MTYTIKKAGGRLQTHFTSGDFSTLSNLCRVAAEKFDENAKMFRACIDHKPAPVDDTPDAEGRIFVDMTPHGEGARRLAVEFERMAEEARAFMELFSEADTMELVSYEDEAAA